MQSLTTLEIKKTPKLWTCCRMNYSTILMFQFVQGMIIFSQEAWCSHWEKRTWLIYTSNVDIRENIMHFIFTKNNGFFLYILPTFSTFDFSKGFLKSLYRRNLNDASYGNEWRHLWFGYWKYNKSPIIGSWSLGNMSIYLSLSLCSLNT